MDEIVDIYLPPSFFSGLYVYVIHGPLCHRKNLFFLKFSFPCNLWYFLIFVLFFLFPLPSLFLIYVKFLNTFEAQMNDFTKERQWLQFKDITYITKGIQVIMITTAHHWTDVTYLLLMKNLFLLIYLLQYDYSVSMIFFP